MPQSKSEQFLRGTKHLFTRFTQKNKGICTTTPLVARLLLQVGKTSQIGDL